MMAIDAIFIPICLWAAYVLRLADWWPADYIEPQWWVFPFSSIFGVAIFSHQRIYRSVLRYISHDALFKILRSIFVLSLSLMILGFYAVEPTMPRSIPIIFAFVCTGYVTTTRYLYRYYYQWVLTNMLSKDPVAIYGAGGAGVQLATALIDSQEYKAVAFIDDDRNLSGSFVLGLRVYHPDDLDRVIGSFDIKHVLLAVPSASPEERNRIVDRLSKFQVNALTMPSIAEIVTGNARIDSLRKVDVKDLLGRDAVVPDAKLLTESIQGKTVLVTGAGGSIGSEICRQVIKSRPGLLILYELNEFSLYQIERELLGKLREAQQECELLPVLGNICDEPYFNRVLSEHNVQTIYHAAAYKHVPMVEQNSLIAIQNNIIGTKIISEAAVRHGVERFILISSDKAVRSTSVMGATKRMAELILQDLARNTNDTIFTMVRFGNVLGSSGSVEPLFREQILSGGPVTVTDPEVTRYFMTIPEASSLVIQAGSMASGGEVFVLEMGQKVKIIDLARRMIRLYGFSVRDKDHPNGDIALEITGLRPGEKMTEELMIGNNSEGTRHPQIFKVHEDIPIEGALQVKIDTITNAIRDYNLPLAIEAISGRFTGYFPKGDATADKKAV